MIVRLSTDNSKIDALDECIVVPTRSSPENVPAAEDKTPPTVESAVVVKVGRLKEENDALDAVSNVPISSEP